MEGNYNLVARGGDRRRWWVARVRGGGEVGAIAYFQFVMWSRGDHVDVLITR